MEHSTETVTQSLFDRAILSVGRHTKSVNIWLLWIDFQTSFYNMAFVNLICYLAVQTPLLQHELVLGK